MTPPEARQGRGLMNLWYRLAIGWTLFFAAVFIACMVLDASFAVRVGLAASAPYPPLLWIAVGKWMP